MTDYLAAALEQERAAEEGETLPLEREVARRMVVTDRGGSRKEPAETRISAGKASPAGTAGRADKGGEPADDPPTRASRRRREASARTGGIEKGREDEDREAVPESGREAGEIVPLLRRGTFLPGETLGTRREVLGEPLGRTERLPLGGDPALPGLRPAERDSGSLLTAMGRAIRGEALLRSGGRRLTVTVPEREERLSPVSVETLDRAVERDARRYDGGFSLY